MISPGPIWHSDFGRRRLRRLPASTAVVLLLLALVGLSVFARTARFLPKSNPAHYTEKASKMDRARPPVTQDWATFRPVLGLLPHVPVVRFFCRDSSETRPLTQICLTALDRHRAPPLSLS